MVNLRRRALFGGGSGDIPIMTSDTNPKILQVLYNAGLCASPDVMYKSEAEAVQSTDLGKPNTYNGNYAIFYNIKAHESFAAFQYFTGITHLYSYCFRNAQFTDIVFPETLEIIEGMWALGEVTAFPYPTMTIPASVTYIGYYCYLKPIVIFKGSVPPNIGDWTAFSGTETTAIYVPDGTVDAYKTAWANKNVLSTWTTTPEEMLALIKPISEYQPN